MKKFIDFLNENYTSGDYVICKRTFGDALFFSKNPKINKFYKKGTTYKILKKKGDYYYMGYYGEDSNGNKRIIKAIYPIRGYELILYFNPTEEEWEINENSKSIDTKIISGFPGICCKFSK